MGITKSSGAFTELSRAVAKQLGEGPSYEPRRWRANKSLREAIRTSDLGDHETLDEKIWALRSNAPVRPKCTVCNGRVKFKSSTEGYHPTCSVKCGANSVTTRTKTKNTLTRIYGGHHMTVPLIKEKLRRPDGTWPGAFGSNEHKRAIEIKYGVKNISHHPDILYKIVSSSPKTKDFTLSSGEKLKLQGYEPQVLQFMLEAKRWEEGKLLFPVPRISVGTGVYTPDFWFPSDNLLVEVKSDYTWFNERFHDRAISRAHAAQDAGYSVEVWIWDPKSKTPRLAPL